MSLYYIFISSSFCESVCGLAQLYANLHYILPITRVLPKVPILYLYFKFHSCESVSGLAQLHANLHNILPISLGPSQCPCTISLFQVHCVSQFVAWLSYMLTYITYCPYPWVLRNVPVPYLYFKFIV